MGFVVTFRFRFLPGSLEGFVRVLGFWASDEEQDIGVSPFGC